MRLLLSNLTRQVTMSRSNTQRDFKRASARRGDGSKKRKTSRAQGAGGNGQLLKLILDLQRDVQQLPEKLIASLRPRLVGSDSKSEALETLFAALFSIYNNSVFNEKWVLDDANQPDEESQHLKHALLSLLPKSKLKKRSLSRFLMAEPKEVGSWRLIVEKFHSKDGRFFRVERVTGLSPSVTVCHRH